MSADNRQFMDRFRDRNRSLLVFAPADDHPGLREQLERAERRRGAVDEREMVVLAVVPHGSEAGDVPVDSVEADALHKRFGVSPESFAVLLVGKDGTEKHRWDAPAPMDEMFALIDRTPMRRGETRRE